MIAFVTGADHGLGLALVKGLLRRGWSVVAGRYGGAGGAPREKSLDAVAEAWASTEAADEVAGNSAKGPARLVVTPLDVRDSYSVAAAADAARAQFGGVDLVINNAGVLGSEALDNRIGDGLDYESIKGTIEVNALGPLRVSEALLPLLTDSSFKRLCFVSSEAGSITRSYRKAWYGYTMSKASLNMGISVLFSDLRPEGFTFRVYHPGWMQTFMSGHENLEATLTPDEAAGHALRYFLDDDIDEDRLVMRDYAGTEWPW